MVHNGFYIGLKLIDIGSDSRIDSESVVARRLGRSSIGSPLNCLAALQRIDEPGDGIIELEGDLLAIILGCTTDTQCVDSQVSVLTLNQVKSSHYGSQLAIHKGRNLGAHFGVVKFIATAIDSSIDNSLGLILA